MFRVDHLNVGRLKTMEAEKSVLKVIQKCRIRLKNLLLFSILLSPLAAAQHADIWLILNGNQTAASETNLETQSPVMMDVTTGRLLFAGDFDDVGQGPDATDDPGFQAEALTFNPSTILYYRAVGSLMFWNGSAWVNNVVDQERIQIEDALSSFTTIDVSGVTNPQGAIDQIAGDGSVHQHVDFSIDNSLGAGAVAPGAYIIDLEFYLTNGVNGPVVHTTSEPVRIAFNYQLSSSEFDAAISALAPSLSVPVPAFALAIFAVLLIATTRWRKLTTLISS